MHATSRCKQVALVSLATLLIVAGCSSANKQKSMQQSQMQQSQMSMAKSFTAALSGTQEVPPTASAATGMAKATLAADGTLHWNVTYMGLSGPAMAAHFHGPAAPGANAGVVVNIGQMGLGSPMQGSAHLTEAQVADLMAGHWYVNIHTASYPDGEIRGQVMPAQ
jgi:hypothetical protein